MGLAPGPVGRACPAARGRVRRLAPALAFALLAFGPCFADEGPAQAAAAEWLPSDSPDLHLRLFGDLGFRAGNREGETRSFSLGQVDLFMTSRLSDSLSVLSEIAFHSIGGEPGHVPEEEAAAEHAGGEHGGVSNDLDLDLERLLIQFSRSDVFRIAAGRYHTSIGYYNTAYHHGTWFQTAVGRPFLFAFEHDGGVLPVHSVGLTASGRIPSGRLGLRYAAEVGNGRAASSQTGHGVQNVVDENDGKSLNLALAARPQWASGLQAGLSVYLDRLTPEGGPRVSETITAAHIVYHGPRLELLNELVAIRHAPRSTGEAFHALGFYTQASRQLGKLRPYVRYQYLDADHEDPILGHIGRRQGPSLGLRYDVGEFAALKVQYDRTARRHIEESGELHKETFDELTAQLAFTF